MLFTDGTRSINLMIYQKTNADNSARPLDITAAFVEADLGEKVHDANSDEALIVEDVNAFVDWAKNRISEENARAKDFEFSVAFVEVEFEAVLDKDEQDEKAISAYQALKAQIARKKKNARQREYQKRTGYAAIAKCHKENTRLIALRFSKSADAVILSKLDSVENKTDYVRQLILNDINK